MPYICRICGTRFPMHLDGVFADHVGRCAKRNDDLIDNYRPAGPPFEGDPELALFAREEGSVYDRRPGTRRRPH
jgi:hypothetical protein